MSTSIEHRVVQMKFDNKQFEEKAAQTMTTLDKFKAKLNFKGAAQGFNEINKAVANVNLNPMNSQIDVAIKKFDAFSVVAITALTRITNAAINAGSRIVKALTFTPVITGFNEYETKMNAIQTIMSNTASKGTTMADVTRVLDELNTYADKTIYNFAEMTRNIGTFTAAGVGLEDSAKAIQGISNLAAASGSSSQQAATAMYQLSQALSSGTVRLMDWNSVVNAGMGGEKFQNALKATAREHGIAIDAMIEKEGSFRESLSQGWLSADILNETLRKFTVQGAKEYAKAMMESGKYTQAQADALIAEAHAMEDAATKVKTFTQLWSTLQESVQSGWSKTWEIIIGDFEEAKALFTEISDAIGNFINQSADARNNMLQYWKDIGGRTQLIEAARAAIEALIKPLGAVRDAVREVLFPGTFEEKGFWLYNLTIDIRDFFRGLIMSNEAVNTLRVSIKVLLLPVKVLIQVLRVGVSAAGALIQTIFILTDAFLGFFSKIGTAKDPLRKVLGNDRYERIASALLKIITGLQNAFAKVEEKLTDIFGIAKDITGSGLGTFFRTVVNLLTPLANWILDRVADGFELIASIPFESFGDMVVGAINLMHTGFLNLITMLKMAKDAVTDFVANLSWEGLLNFAKSVGNAIYGVATRISDFFRKIDIQPVIDFLVEKFGTFKDVIIGLGEAISNFVNGLTPSKVLIFAFGTSIVMMILNLSSAISTFKKVGKGFINITKGVTGALKAVTERIKGNKFMQIALAITALAGALIILSNVNPEGLKQATISLGILMGAFVILVGLLAAIEKFLLKTPEMVKGFKDIGTAMLAMSAGIALLAGAIALLSIVDMEDMWGRIGMLIAVMGAMIVGVKLLGSKSKQALSNSVFILSFALAMNLMVKTLADMSNKDITFSIESVLNMIIVVGLLSVLARSMKGIKFTTGLGMLTIIGSILLFAKAMEKITSIDTASLYLALFDFIPIFIALALLSDIAGEPKDMLKLGIGFAATAAAVLILYEGIKLLGSLSLGTLVKGTVVVTGLILLFALMEDLANGNGGEKGQKKMKSSFLAMAASILILGLAIDYIGSLSIEDIVKGGAVVSAMLYLMARLANAIGTTKKATGTVVAITLMLTALISALALLTLIDTVELLVSTASITMVIYALSNMFTSLQKAKPKKALKSALAFTVIAMAIGGMIAALTNLDPSRALASATALSEVMIALGVAMKLISGGKKKFKMDDVRASLEEMAGILVLAMLVLNLLNIIPVQEGLIEKATSLSLLIAALGGVAYLLSSTKGKFDLRSGASAGGGIASFVGILIITLGAIGLLFQSEQAKLFLSSGIDTINSLYRIIPAIVAIGAISAAFSKLNIDVAAAAKASAAIGVFSGILVGILWVIGLVMSAISSEEAHLDAGVMALTKLGEAIGGFVSGILGPIVSVLGSSVASALRDVGTGLSDFMTNASVFFEGIKGIDSNAVSAVASLADMMMTLTASDFLDSINIFNSGNPLVDLGYALKLFGPPFKEFYEDIEDMKPEVLTAAGAAIQSLALLLSQVPVEGGLIGTLFTGTADWDGFTEGLEGFAEGFAGFVKIIEDNDITKDSVDRVSYAMTALTNMANSIPPSGGILQEFFGNKDVGVFGRQLKKFGRYLVGFFRIITGQDESVGEVNIDYGLVTTCANAGKALADFANSIPSTGGYLQDWLGSKNLSNFGTQIECFAEGLVGFFKVFTDSGITIDQTLVDSAVNAGKAFKDFTDQLPNTGGHWQEFVGRANLGTFGTDIGNFGEGLYDFFDYFKDAKITDEDVTTATNAGEAFRELVNNLKPNSGPATWFEEVNLNKYGAQLASLGWGLSLYYDYIEDVDVDALTSSTTAIQQLAGLADDISDISLENAVGFIAFLNGMAESGITAFSDTFSGATEDLTNTVATTLSDSIEAAKTQVETAGFDFSGLVGAMVASLIADKGLIGDAAFDLASWFKVSFDARKSLFRECGTTIVESMKAGLDYKKEALEEYAAEVATWFVDNVKFTFDIVGEYSQVFYTIGKQCIAGFVKGFEAEAVIALARIQEISNDLAVAAEDALEVNSPSKRFMDIGMYCMLGLSKGIDENSRSAIGSSVKIGENIVEALKETLGIKSPSRVTRDEVGRYIVEGIAEGIDKDDSAEEAARKKAQNIVSAFQEEFSKLDATMDTANLEFELWQSMNPNATEAQISAAQLEMLDKSMKTQAEKVNMANAQYQATLQQLGAESEQTIEAYNAYLQEKISLSDMAAQLSQLQSSNAYAFREFDRLYRESLVELKDSGMTQDEIRQYALEVSGWRDPKDPNSLITPKGSIENIMNSYLSAATAGSEKVDVVIVESVKEATEEAFNEAEPVAKTGGSRVAYSAKQGIDQALNEIKQNSQPVDWIEEALGIDVSKKDDSLFNKAKESAWNLISGFELGVDEASEHIDGAGGVLSSIFGGIPDLINTFLGEHSPSVYTHESGYNLVLGLANGISDPEANGYVNGSLKTVSDNSVRAFDSLPGSFSAIGSNIMQGLANGITSNSYAAVNAAQNVVNRIMGMTNSMLEIHSPSRVYYEIGKYMDQGLANGIIDNASIITDSISQVVKKANKAASRVSKVNSSGGYWNREGVWVSNDRPLESKHVNQLLRWDAAGNLIPIGFDLSKVDIDTGSWAIVPSHEIADRIRWENDKQLEKFYKDQAVKGRYIDDYRTMKELVEKVEQGADYHDFNQLAPPIVYNQTVNSPKYVNSAEVYRATKTQLNSLKTLSGSIANYSTPMPNKLTNK